jgi:hypothetical protein
MVIVAAEWSGRSRVDAVASAFKHGSPQWNPRAAYLLATAAHDLGLMEADDLAKHKAKWEAAVERANKRREAQYLSTLSGLLKLTKTQERRLAALAAEEEGK